MITFKKRYNLCEAEIQALFYNECKKNNIECYLEYQYKDCRFDAVIIYNRMIILIIEFKELNIQNPIESFLCSKQYFKYTKYTVPVSLVGDIIGIKRIIIFLKDYINILKDCKITRLKDYRDFLKKVKIDNI